ncbi:MAG TPA: lipase maturation factor family protein [Vicinamibacterales bacterium]|nr:lipase maturation factor family protein [Vicinamibacterales bacterium]
MTPARANWLFLRLLGVVYFLAFWSLSGQIVGLIGAGGILPARAYMASARGFVLAEQIGVDRFRLLPTLCWISTSDAFLRGLALSGAALGVLLVAGVLPTVVLVLLWLDYLSLSVVAREFLSYQWDALLLETGFLAIFVAPLVLIERPRAPAAPPRLGIWLMLWLSFRLMFGSGIVKLASGDPTWRNLTAMTFHYETQPIPTPVAWYAHQMPLWFHKATTAATLTVELVAPFFIVAPLRLRRVAFLLLVGLQLLIAITGNYAFFNILAAGLCVYMLADRAANAPVLLRERIRNMMLVALAVAIGSVSATMFAARIGLELPTYPLVSPLADFIEPLRSVNTYGLFAVMTTTRPEIIVEGSNDGEEWKPYEFAYKAGDVRRRPPWVAPHQPRLDWQMWFAALGDAGSEPWFQRFCHQLLTAAPDVLRLLAYDPFGGRAPKYVRAVLYQYHYASPEEHRRGIWWRRERLGEYLAAQTAAP